MVLLVMMSMPGLDAAAAATWKLAMVSLLLLKAACIIPNQCKHTHQLKRKKGEAKLIDARSPKPKDMAWYIQPEISQKSLGIFPPHFPFAFLMKKLRREKRKAPRTKEGSDSGRNFYLLLVLVPIGWIKIDRNRRKDHGIELISFDLLLLGRELLLLFLGLFVPPRFFAR